MDKNILISLDDIQVKLSDNISTISVIADGLSCYIRNSALTGDNARNYVNALISIHRVLTEIAGEFGATLACASFDNRETGGVA